MTITTIRPNFDAFIIHATRTPAGSPLYQSLDNATPLTGEYITFTAGAPSGRGEYIAGMAGSGISLTGKRVRAVRARIDLQNVSDPGKDIYVTLLLRDPAYDPTDSPKDTLSSTQAGVIVSRPGRWNTLHPAGGGWGAPSFDRLEVRLATYTTPSGVFPRVHGMYVDIDLKDQPTIDPVSASALNTTRPTIGGTFDTAEGDLLNRVQVKVFTATQVAASGFNPETSKALWDSGVRVTTVASVTIGTDLAPSTTYTAYMKAAYLVNGTPFWSAWASTPVTLATSPPSPPTLTVTPDTSLSRALLALTGKVNILTADDASFETSVGNWTLGTGVTSRATSVAQARHGLSSLAVTFSGAAGPFLANDGNAGAGLRPVSQGQQFRLSGYARANTTARQFQIVARWLTPALVYISQTNGTAVSDSSSAWTALPELTATAPADGFLAFQIQSTQTPAAGEIHYFDQLQIVPGSTSTPWSPGGLFDTTTMSIESWDRATGRDNLAPLMVARLREGTFNRTAANTLDDSMLNSYAGSTAQRWTIASGGAIDIGWLHGTFDDDLALPGVPGMLAIASIYIRSSLSGQLSLAIDAHDAAGTPVAQPAGSSGNVTVGTTLTRYSVAVVLPPLTAHCKVSVNATAGLVGAVVDLSAFAWELRPAGSSSIPGTWVPGQGIPPNWQPVRYATEQTTDAGQALTVADFEVPPNIPRLYRARSNAILPGLTENLATPYVVGAMGVVWFAPTGTWVLKDPYEPSRNTAVRVVGATEGWEPSTAVFQPSGAGLSVAFTDFVGGLGGQLTVVTLGDIEFAQLRALLESGNILLLDLPEGGHRYLAVQRASWPRAGPLGQIQRQVSIDVAEVSAPPDLD